MSGTTTDSLKKKKATFQIIPSNKIISNNKKFEEIDLLLILKDVVIVAEIKCIKFPIEPRDKHNSIRRLTEGVKQVKRKVNFLTLNKTNLERTDANIWGI